MHVTRIISPQRNVYNGSVNSITEVLTIQLRITPTVISFHILHVLSCIPYT